MDKNLIRLSKSCIGKQEKALVLSVLDEEYLGMGKYVEKFEKKLSQFFQRQAVCLVNGTAALQLSLQGCNIKDGDEVLVPSLTYLSSFQSITANKAVPIACDVDQNSFIIDLNDAEKRINKKTKAIMPVFFSGGVNSYYKIYDFAKTYKLRVIEDAAHAFGSKVENKLIGSIGDISCFSFDGIKNITSGEGGCIVSNDEELINKIKDLRLLGIIKDTHNRYIGKRSWDFQVSDQGWRYHMSNIMAAIGIAQFDRLEEFSNSRKKIAKIYDKLFKSHSRIQVLERDYDAIVPHIYVIKIKGLKKRDLLRKKLLEKGIETGIHYLPNHYLEKYSLKEGENLPNTEKIYSQILTLPIHPEIKEKDINFIVDNLNLLLNSSYLKI